MTLVFVSRESSQPASCCPAIQPIRSSPANKKAQERVLSSQIIPGDVLLSHAVSREVPSGLVITDYHAKYYAHALTRRSASDNLEKLGQTLLNATVDLNPHQIDAAMFAFRSPLSRGALLADEVGLGKTIEAALIISQLWAERHRKILVIVPTTLRKQWAQELAEKFFLTSEILDTRSFAARRKSGSPNPLADAKDIVICSYHFARAQKEAIQTVEWNLVVVDEAHRLRNVYKPSNRIARAIKEAIEKRPKVLLTATPLQNSLLELWGLIGFLDEHLFGDLASFRSQYGRGPLSEAEFQDLRRRLHPLCQRTLRRQVAEYVRYTNRIPITQDFTPTDDEQRLYDAVSAYLQRDELQALPSSQRKLMTLVLRKLLASSSFAIAGTLKSLMNRLSGRRPEPSAEATAPEQDFENFEQLVEEWAETEPESPPETPAAAETKRKREALEAEIQELAGYHDLATSIRQNAKGQALLKALALGFDKLASLGANRKAIIFSESRRTQAYLLDLLESNGFAGQMMTFNGTNTDRRSAEIYKAWRERHAGEDVVSGSKEIDIRAALIQHFRDSASIMIATEAAAEGVNLQFCSLVVNYDLPWNPQRIEQRIGRCHRYGQKHDVVVINFLNRRNEADQRVFQLLSEKFRLFDGIFGASDEVLGALESGVDFERRIADIYQTCRTPAEIDAAFDALQQQLEEEIGARMATARSTLLENFDEEVHARLRLNERDTTEQLDRFTRWLWAVARHELRDDARFEEKGFRFDLVSVPAGCQPVPTGAYRLITERDSADGHHAFRAGHPLAQFLLDRASQRPMPVANVVFNYSGRPGKISLVEQLIGRRGVLSLARLAVTALEREDHLVFSAFEDREPLDQETCDKLFEVGGEVAGSAELGPEDQARVAAGFETAEAAVLARIAERNGRFFEEEIEKLERWAEDLKGGLEQELKDLDAEIKAVKKEAKLQADLETKLALHRKAKDLEAERSRKRRSLYDAQDEIDRRKETLIGEVEGRLKQKVESERLFTIRWTVR